MVGKVGVRELRRDLSEYLRRVERGESFAVTSRGRAVAVLGPSPGQRDPLVRLVLEREAVPARIDVLEVEFRQQGHPVVRSQAKARSRVELDGWHDSIEHRV